MSELQSTSDIATTADITPVEDVQSASQAVVKTENHDQQQLYIDAPPVLPAGSQLTEDGNKSESQVVKRLDPRRQWINTDASKPYFCKLCDFNMESMEVFQHHCMSPRHVKRAIEEFNIKLPRRLDDKEEKKAPPEYNCQVCLVTCNSDTAWNSHLLGQKHRKALEKQGAERAQQKAQDKSNLMHTVAMNTGYGRGAGRGAVGRGVVGRGAVGRGGGGGPIRGGSYNPGHMRKPYDKPMHAVQQPSLSGPIGARDFATYPEPLIGLEYVTEIQVIGQSPRYHCELCDSKFDHNLKFPHLVGSKHRFNVLKEKVPEVAQNIRGDVKKRSELSSKLLEEANKLEMMEGRQQVKTRMEKSPFNLVNNQAAATRGGFSGNTKMQQTSRGGGQQWQSQRGGGRGSARGGQGGARGGQGGARGGQGGVRGGYSSARGGGQSTGNFRGGGQGAARGGGRGRGNQQATSYNYQQQSLSNRGGRGRGRGSGGSNQTQSWNQNFSSYNNAPNQTYSDSSYSGGGDSSQWNISASHGSGEGERMLPVAAFKPRSPSRSQNQVQQQFSNYYDNYYDNYYGSANQDTSNSSSNYQYNDSYSDQTTYSSQNTNEQSFQSHDQAPSATYSSQNTNEQSFQSHGQAPSATDGSSSDSGGASGNKSVSLLQGAIADLGKLVSSEEDASMALQVSNALTQALLQFRMNNLNQEGAVDNSTAASTATPMNTGT